MTSLKLLPSKPETAHQFWLDWIVAPIPLREELLLGLMRRMVWLDLLPVVNMSVTTFGERPNATPLVVTEIEIVTVVEPSVSFTEPV